MVWLIGFGVTIREILRVKNTKLFSQQKNTEILYFQELTSANGGSESNNQQLFLNELNEIFL